MTRTKRNDSTKTDGGIRHLWVELLIVVPLILSYCTPYAEAKQQTTLKINHNERWWAGVISQSHLMPLHDKSYSFDSDGDIAGNQVQP